MMLVMMLMYKEYRCHRSVTLILLYDHLYILLDVMMMRTQHVSQLCDTVCCHNSVTLILFRDDEEMMLLQRV